MNDKEGGLVDWLLVSMNIIMIMYDYTIQTN